MASEHVRYYMFENSEHEPIKEKKKKSITNPQRLGVNLIGRVCVPYVESRGFTRTSPKEKYKHTEIHSVLL